MSERDSTCVPLPQTDGVEYRTVPGFPRYAVGNDGTVWSSCKGGEWRRLAQRRVGDMGYACVSIVRHDGRTLHRKVGRLVLEAFVGPCPPGMEMRHYPDRDPMNSRLDNLSWSTHLVNVRDSINQGTFKTYHPNGEGHPNAKLTNAQVLEIVARGNNGEPQALLAREFGICHQNIDEILDGSRWSSVTGIIKTSTTRDKRGELNPSVKLREQDVLEIVRRKRDGESHAKIAKAIGISRPTVVGICNGYLWSHLTGITKHG